VAHCGWYEGRSCLPQRESSWADREEGLYRDPIGPIPKRADKPAHMKTKQITGYSLRSGMVTRATINGVS